MATATYTTRSLFAMPDSASCNWKYHEDRNKIMQDQLEAQDALNNLVVSGGVITDTLPGDLEVNLADVTVTVGGESKDVAATTVTVQAATSFEEQYNIIFIDSSGNVQVYAPGSAVPGITPTGDFVLLGVVDCDIGDVLRIGDLRRFTSEGDHTPMENDFQNSTPDIWQSYSGAPTAISAATEEFVADRIGNYRTAGATLTITREAFTVGQTVVPGNPKYFHNGIFTTDSGADEEVYHFIRIKDVERYAGQTVAFKLHGSMDASKDIALEVTQNFGSGGSTAVQVGVETISLTTTDTKQILFITFPSISGKTLGTLSYSEFKIWLSAGSDFNGNTNSLGNQPGTLNISEIKIYPSDKELPVRRRTPEQELSLCLPYGRLIARYDNDSAAQGIGVSTIVTNIGYLVLTFDKMVKVPSLHRDNVVDSWVVNGKTNLNGDAITIASAGKESIRIQFALTGTNFDSATLSTRLSGAYMYLRSEL